MDRLTPEKRSANMSAVRSQNTKPEIRVRSVLHRAGYRFRLHRRDLPGSPDIVLPRYQTVVFVHGCFWHGHDGCRRSKLPATRTEFWQAKIERNRDRDEAARAALIALGYRVVTLWECELKSESSILSTVDDVTGRRVILEGVANELDAKREQLSSEHDIIPFISKMLTSSEMKFQAMPIAMLDILRSSPDFQSLRPGDQPTWLQVASGDNQLELVVYRAEGDGKHYVLAPNKEEAAG